MKPIDSVIKYALFSSMALLSLNIHANPQTHDSDIVFKPGGPVALEAASGMVVRDDGEGWSFNATNNDPYTRVAKLPQPIPLQNLSAVCVEIERVKPAPSDRVEIFFVLNNGKGVVPAQKLSARLLAGRQRYLFDMTGVEWANGAEADRDLTGLRIDPASSPGPVSIYSIQFLGKNSSTASANAAISDENSAVHVRPNSLATFRPEAGDVLEAASGMTPIPGQPWTFNSINNDPYTRPFRLPKAIDTAQIKAIAIEIEKAVPAAKDTAEVFFILDNGKGITASQKLSMPLKRGRHTYIFPMDGIFWFRGKLTSLRLDPASAPGKVAVKSITIFSALPSPSSNDVLVEIPEGLKTSLGPTADTFGDAALVRYRLTAERMDFAIIDTFEGETKVVKMQVKNKTSAPDTARLRLAADRLKPFAPTIPPYIGLHAHTLKLKIFSDSQALLSGISLNMLYADGTTETLSPPLSHAHASANRWNACEWPLGKAAAGDVFRPLRNIEIIANVPPDTDGFFYVADAHLLHATSSKTYDLLTTDTPLMTTGMAAPLASDSARPLPTRDSIALGGYTLHEPKMAAGIAPMGEFMKKNFPEFDFIIAPVWTPPLSVHRLLPTLPDNVFFQFQKAQLVPAYLKARGRMPQNSEGRQLEDFGNALLATDLLIQTGIKDEIDYAASLGVNNFKQADMVWPYVGGRWGYDPASVNAYRETLQEKDEGLLLLPGFSETEKNSGSSKKQTLFRFWDYYEYYHGFRLKPADLGLATWDDYVPISERAASTGGVLEKRNLGLYILLYHYEWLRQAQRFGRWAKAHGGKHDYTFNPEDLGDAGDHVFLVRLADGGIPYIEYFGGPAILRAAFHNLPMYVATAKQAGSKFGMIMEIGQAGHGQNYLDPEVAWMLSFELAAGGCRSFHNEWAEADWATMTNPQNEYHYDRWSAWMSSALGFSLARTSEIRRVPSRVLNISIRSSGYYINSWTWNIHQQSSFGPLLADHNVHYEQWDRSAMPAALGQADVVFYSPPAARKADGVVLERWLSGGEGRSLVTHSSVPFTIDDGQARLAPNVSSVSYRGELKNYSDFLSTGPNATEPIFPALKGTTRQSNGRWSLPAGAELLVGDKPQPLLSHIRLPKGGDIFYLHVDPQTLTLQEQAEVMTVLQKHLSLPRIVSTSSTPVMAHSFSADVLETLNIWNRKKLDELGFFGGYGPHLLPYRGASQYDRKKRPYPYLADGTAMEVTVPVEEAGEWRIYDFLSDKETVQTVTLSEKHLRLSAAGVLSAQFHYGRDSELVRRKIEDLKRERARLIPYCPDISLKK